MKKNTCALLFIVFIALSLTDLTGATVATRLTNQWMFLKQDVGNIWEVVRPTAPDLPESVPLWTPVRLPHCYNAEDGVDPDVNYYQGPAWYKTQLKISNPFPDGRIILDFAGAGQRTDVYVYMTKVGSHLGGYDRWSVDITNAVNEFLKTDVCRKQFKGKVPLSVRCDNSRDTERIPSSMSDFNVYGGIYRPLTLVYQPAVSFRNTKIDASCDAKGKKGHLLITTDWVKYAETDSARVEVSIFSPKNKLLIIRHLAVNKTENSTRLLETDLSKPALWSPALPQRYRCEVTLHSPKGDYKEVSFFGFRHFEFLEKGPFMLNGQRLLLRGTHRHEDHAGVGAAMSDAQIRAEMVMMKEMGVNFIRLGHYQQSDIVLDLCDSLGILVWEEIPWCRGGLGGDQYKKQARESMTNMISQHRNHPSVILWGLGNENDWAGDFPEFDKQKIHDFMAELNGLVHQLDSTRKTSIRRCDFCKDVPDVYSPSIWAGWYRGAYTEYKTMTDKEIQRVPRFFHAEWGGDSHAGRHSESPDSVLQLIELGKGVDERLGDAARVGGGPRVSKDGDWSESYICNLFDWHLKEQEEMPYLSGSAFWIFKDFSTPVRPDNPIPYMNQKGVVERDLTPKESYYLFQSRWTEKPMLHIYGHTWPVRWGNAGEQKMVKVFSNCNEVELFLNGKSCGVRKRDIHAFPAMGLHWQVVLPSGEYTLKAVGRKDKATLVDEIKQTYQTEKWGRASQLELRSLAQKGDTATIEVKMFDANHVLCLDARQVVEFGLTGDGRLIDNLGTTSGSRKVELQNGRAIIRIKLNGGKSVASVKSPSFKTQFCTIAKETKKN